MRRILIRLLKIFAVLIALVLLIALTGAYWFVSRAFPQTSGSLQIEGLNAPVEVIRDAQGLAQIYADSPDDLFFAQGYVHAQDRLWQMELNRHVGHGQLSELFGETKYGDSTTVKVDQFLRTIGLDGAARADLAALDGETRGYLQRYADGVNGFIHSHQDNLPLEFTLLGTRPTDWSPVDSLVWGQVMNYDLGSNYSDELFRERLVQALGPDRAAQLFPPYPESGPFIIPSAVEKFSFGTDARNDTLVAALGPVDLDSLASLNRAVGAYPSGIGSNNWVVDGAKSTTGKPILANDPHLGIGQPSIWYADGLHCRVVSPACPFDVVGLSFPGAPGIIVGHNSRIAWGVTNGYPDVQDLFVEKVNPANPNQYWYEGGWRDMEISSETIHVKGKPDIPFAIRSTAHGPIMTPVLKDVTATVALEWTSTREPNRLFRSVLDLDRAQNWEEFRDALRLWDAPSQNFVYADIDGNIGYQLPGRIPIRAEGDGSMPAEGASGQYEWTGYIPFDDLPSVYNPSSHYIASANNKQVPDGYKYLIARDYDAPFRATRINDVLKEKSLLSPADMQRLQADLYSLPMARLQRHIAAVQPTGFLGERALEYVRKWDGNVTQDSIGAAIVEVSYVKLVHDLFEKQLGADLFPPFLERGDLHNALIYTMLDDPNHPLWDDPTTPAKETREQRVTQAYLEGVDWLGSQFGDWPPEWQWGRIHTATFAHPFGSIQPLDRLFNVGPMRMPGDGYTVDVSHFAYDSPYVVTSIPSMRLIVDLSNLDSSVWIHAPGQSGQPFNAHYSDLASPWHDVRYFPLLFTRDSVQMAGGGTLTLQPKK